MSRQLEVSFEAKHAYTIYLEQDFSRLTEAVKELHTASRRALIITDENVAPLYLREIEHRLGECFRQVQHLILTPGEAYKNTDSIARIYEVCIEAGLDRSDFLVALGGGVIGDMTGFAAATYMRGIRFIQIPTTLLSQVDSSIGGKTGVDFRSFKNMVGAFHMPSLVYSSISALQTLDSEQYASGMGEVIKHALIRDREYLDLLISLEESLQRRDPEVLEEVIYRSNRIKALVVERDPKERGERQILNFGHTLGHAIEKCSSFRYSHGQCVAFGCLAALYISNISSREQDMALRSLMESVGLKTIMDLPIPPEEIIAATRRDKKMDQGHVRFILLRELGDAYVDLSVTDEQMLAALKNALLQKQ